MRNHVTSLDSIHEIWAIGKCEKLANLLFKDTLFEVEEIDEGISLLFAIIGGMSFFFERD